MCVEERGRWVSVFFLQKAKEENGLINFFKRRLYLHRFVVEFFIFVDSGARMMEVT